MLELIDLTSLNETDTVETIAVLCQKAVQNSVAAVCVYPKFISEVKKNLINTSIRIATVANFPEGTDSIEKTMESIEHSVDQGIDEIDVVFPYQDYLRGEHQKVYDFVRLCKMMCGEKVILKIILETGALQDPVKIAEASFIVCHAGADFLKTSTGKIAVGATLDAARAMLEVIKEFPREVGLKISGGIRTVEQVEQYIQLAREIMGKDWVMPEHFRIGTSRVF